MYLFFCFVIDMALFFFQYLDNIKHTIMDHLKCIAGAPSIQMQDVSVFAYFQIFVSFNRIHIVLPKSSSLS